VKFRIDANTRLLTYSVTT